MSSFGCPRVSKEIFGECGDEIVYKYTLSCDKLVVSCINYGATMISVSAPDSNGKFEDVALCHNNMPDLLNDPKPYYGNQLLKKDKQLCTFYSYCTL